MTVPVDQLHIVIRLFSTEFSGNDMIDRVVSAKRREKDRAIAL
jgi:hypothetical protein